MHLRPEDVQDIVSLLDSLAHDEFELRTSDLHVTVRRAGSEGWTQESRVLSAPNVVATETVATETVATETVATETVATDIVAVDIVATDAAAVDSANRATRRTAQDSIRPGLVGIRAPLPGTFYRAAKPGADPYVEVGSHVEEDTVVGLLETMKLFNSVHANVRGEVVGFLIDDAEPAEMDAVLILVRPDAMAEG
ncbi:MAG TPA: biotin/lipoyl-containing protein [Micromonosporaceae bacterium]